MAHGLDELEQAAMLIVLEAPRRSDAPTHYVRRELVAMLEAALRKRGHNVDVALRWMRDYRRKEKKEHEARLAAANKN